MNANWFGDWGRGDYAEHRQTFNRVLDEDIEAQYSDLPHRKGHKKNKVRQAQEQARLRHRPHTTYDMYFKDNLYHWRVNHHNQISIVFDDEWKEHVEQAKKIGNKSIPHPSKLARMLRGR